MKTTTKSITITNGAAMTDRSIDVTFTCDLNGVQVWVYGSYNIGLNAFNPSEVNNEFLDDFAETNNFDEYELRSALQEAFENR